MGGVVRAFLNVYTTTAGETIAVKRRERHQVLTDHKTGAPVYFYNGVENGDADFSFTAGQPIAH
jgi:hypothetical protein